MNYRHLVIGGSGFVGSHLVEAILEGDESSSVSVFDNLSMGKIESEAAKNSSRVELMVGDATEPLQLLSYIESYRPNKVWHLAANSDISNSAISSEVDLKSTFGTTAGVCMAISRMSYRLDSLTFSSTSAIFGSHLTPIDESSPCRPESSYGWMKLASEGLLKALHSSGAVAKVLVARFPNVTGLRQTHGVVKDLVYKYFETSQDWQILGDGFQEKPYIHAKELVEILIKVEAGLEPESFFQLNVSPDTTSTVRSIVERIESCANKNRTPRYGNTPYGWSGDIPKYEFDTSKLRSLGIRVSSSSDSIAKSVEEEVAAYIG